MIVIEKEVGAKVPYEVIGRKIFFNDELMINLEKYERDFEQTLDICVDENKCLSMGLAKSYIAQVNIPARVYNEIQVVPDSDSEEETTTSYESQSLDMDTVTLSLWSAEGLLDE